MYSDLYGYIIYWMTYVNELVKLQQLLFPILSRHFYTSEIDSTH